jgi:hypothetical protein
MDIASFDDQIKFRRIMALHELRLPKGRLSAYRPSFRRAGRAPSGAMQRVSVKTYFFPPEKRAGTIIYMKQEGKGRDGQTPELFTEAGKNIEDTLNGEYAAEERIYKIILSPENGDQLDMEQYTRDFMKGLEQSEGRQFKWAAAVHYDTEHPHAHILIRGADENEKDVSFSRDTIKFGMRGQASRLATMELGHRTEQEIRAQKERDLRAERFTRHDKKIKESCRDNMITPKDRDLKARLEYLSDIGLASKKRGAYTVDAKFETKLKYLQRDKDILRTVYGRDANVGDRDFSIYRKGWTVNGVIIRKGIENEITEKSFALVQDSGGKKYYVSDNQIKAFRLGDSIRITGHNEEGKITTVISPSRRDKEMER